MNGKKKWMAVLVAVTMFPLPVFSKSQKSVKPKAPVVSKKKDSRDSNDIIARIESRYRTVKTVQCNFNQTYTNIQFGVPDEHSGTVAIQKPGKMKWKYLLPEDDQKQIITNGKTVWIYRDADKETSSEMTLDDKEAMGWSFLLGTASIHDQFTVLGKSKTQLFLKPKKSGYQIDKLTLTWDDKQKAITTVEMIDEMGNRNRIQFTNIRFNDTLHEKFEPPVSSSLKK